MESESNDPKVNEVVEACAEILAFAEMYDPFAAWEGVLQVLRNKPDQILDGLATRREAAPARDYLGSLLAAFDEYRDDALQQLVDAVGLGRARAMVAGWGTIDQR